MADLHAIDPEPAAQDVIATLERALAQARAGELSSVAVAAVYRDGAVGAEWSTLPSRAAMLGSVSRLAHKLNVEADE